MKPRDNKATGIRKSSREHSSEEEPAGRQNTGLNGTAKSTHRHQAGSGYNSRNPYTPDQDHNGYSSRGNGNGR